MYIYLNHQKKTRDYYINSFAAVSGLTALHLAIANDDPKLTERLLSHPSIDANPKNKIGLTPVRMATIRGKTKALGVIILLAEVGILQLFSGVD